jgi:hypothetical protein
LRSATLHLTAGIVQDWINLTDVAGELHALKSSKKNYPQRIKENMTLHTQLIWLFILAIPIACVAWTVTHEAIFAEPRAFCQARSLTAKNLLSRKFFYLFTCEYCFSFYLTALFLLITRYHLLFMDWRGYLISGFSLIWIANIYMSLFLFIRTDIKKEGVYTKMEESELKNKKINI